MSHSLLVDSLFRIRRADEEVVERTLPEILATLSDAEILSFEALQSHQKQAWHSFLVQLASMAVARERGGTVPTTVSGWQDALIGLADGEKAAWHLVVSDVSRPAFLQPPVPEGTLEEAGYKDDVPTPDQLDVLITSKNHDVKARRITRPRPEHWIYALVTLQTMEGFLGRGNYGIVRMNGGFGNRPMVGLAPELSWGERYRRDRDVLIGTREDLEDMYAPEGLALLWLLPWDGAKESGLPLGDLDPHFIEICRRIRFAESEGQLACWRATTKGQRVSVPNSLNGRTGDPWTPVDKNGEKTLTVGASGFDYQRLNDIFLSGEYERPPALRFHPGETDQAYLIARVLVRGQGQTDGLHHRVVPVPRNASRWLRDETRRERLARRARARIEAASEVRSRVLYPAIGTLLGGGDAEAVDAEEVAPWLDAFDRAVDASFFDSLWASVEMGQKEARRHWQTFLREQAQTQFEDAEQRAPNAAARYWRARSSAQLVFYGSARSVLPAAFSSDATDRR